MLTQHSPASLEREAANPVVLVECKAEAFDAFQERVVLLVSNGRIARKDLGLVRSTALCLMGVAGEC